MNALNQKPPKNQGIKRNQQGSAIIWVFIMIALFGALTYALNQNTRSGAQNISDKQAVLAASELFDDTTAIKNTVQTLLINGCDKDELSFENPLIGSGQANPNAPSDYSCHIFRPEGGNLNTLRRSKKAIDPYGGSAGQFYTYFVNSIQGIGTSAPDVYAFTRPLLDEVCNHINDNLGNNFSVGLPEIDISSNGYNGDISAAGKLTFGDEPAEAGIENKREACVIDTGCTGAPNSKCNAYFKVIIEQ